MTEKLPPAPTAAADDAPADPARRRLLGGIALAGAALAVGGCQSSDRGGSTGATSAAGSSALDAALREHIKHVVVIYAENRSFNNLFGGFPGLAQPLSALKPEQFQQLDRDGKPLATLPPIWHGLVPHKQTLDGRDYQIAEDAIRDIANAPFALHTPEGEPLPHALVTRDLIHSFYNNQLQINGGKNNGFVAWGDSGALVMGHYATGADNFALWRLAQQFTLCDNFFMGAFGGSFLNHQYLVAAQPPFFPDADKTPAQFQITQLEGDDPTGTCPKLADDSPASAMQGRPKFASRMALTPDFWAVNTMGPPYAPAFTKDPKNPALADPADPSTLPPQLHASIGDRLSAAKVDWAWYGGGWQLALDGKGVRGSHDSFPYGPNFQEHHQPLNYFRAFAPGTPARAQHLRDGGTGSEAATNHFIADIANGTLPAVAFYKPQGDLNMHAGYSDIAAGDAHIAAVIDALQKSPLWSQTLVVITVDENGGWWDHVAPPKGDRWGPGTRIPALVISPYAKKGHVDHTIYDTGSIQRFLNRRFGLEPLPGIAMRDKAMMAAGGPAPGDLTAALDFGRG
ncbi:acid phosphatase [Rhodanobacter sp. DHG33]|uniref:acid phosphatase n=1 Tax=Rhodanobacter sp. DHG33 TaxID=2775921 RepID=UPI0017824699|nr:acid phosphatase [Rhodanobacter sp. DHG33]MBD8899578.1 acid phosphatase [Rhodanobacter sp. DHG33]